MAIDNDLSVVDLTSRLGRLRRDATAAIRLLVVTLLGATWVGFWVLVIRIHLRSGDFVAVGVVALVFVLPAAVGLLYYLRASLAAD